MAGNRVIIPFLVIIWQTSSLTALNPGKCAARRRWRFSGDFRVSIAPESTRMILSDRDIKRLIGEVLVGAESRLISPNGIEVRLGKKVKFMSTGEVKAVSPGKFINVHPGESVPDSSNTISS
jgi:hypothetical protein